MAGKKNYAQLLQEVKELREWRAKHEEQALGIARADGELEERSRELHTLREQCAALETEVEQQRFESSHNQPGGEDVEAIKEAARKAMRIGRHLVNGHCRSKNAVKVCERPRACYMIACTIEPLEIMLGEEVTRGDASEARARASTTRDQSGVIDYSPIVSGDAPSEQEIQAAKAAAGVR